MRVDDSLRRQARRVLQSGAHAGETEDVGERWDPPIVVVRRDESQQVSFRSERTERDARTSARGARARTTSLVYEHSSTIERCQDVSGRAQRVASGERILVPEPLRLAFIGHGSAAVAFGLELLCLATRETAPIDRL